MTRKISKETMEHLLNHTYYEYSALSQIKGVQWHHVFTYAGKQIDAPWNIVPLTKEEHQMVTPHHHSYIKELDEVVQLLALNNATDEELEKYPKRDFKALKEELQEKYGTDYVKRATSIYESRI